MKTIKFKACKYLDFEPNYGNCKRQLFGDGKLFWMRPDYGDSRPSMVQFCKLRGRINNAEICLEKHKAYCNDYEEIEHNIKVSVEEIEHNIKVSVEEIES